MGNRFYEESDIQAIADAIRAKNGSENTYLVSEMAAAVEAISGGSSSSGKKEVNFRDYDGTILYSYTVAEAAALTELPPLPSQPGLVCQGWNWSLEDIRAFGRPVEVGAMYITDDGRTRLYITIEDKYRMNVPLYLPGAKAGTMVDWGDGSEEEPYSTTMSHTYATTGEYVISIAFGVGSSLYSNDSYYGIINPSGSRERICDSVLRKVEIGSNISAVGKGAFGNCKTLSSITLPDNITSIGGYAFYGCSSLTSIDLPNTVTSIGSYAFQYCCKVSKFTFSATITSIGDGVLGACYNLTEIDFPYNTTRIAGFMFSGCCCLKSITLPDNIASIGGYAFYGCSSLASIDIPNTVTSIGGYAFYNCKTLSSITLPDNITSIGDYTFSGCSSLTSIDIPNTVTRIGFYAFGNCNALPSITLPDGFTSIGSSAFSNCYALTSITIPNGVTIIGSSTFNNCYSMRACIIMSTTPPTLSNTNAFSNTPSDFVIYVPAESVDAYKAATNWSYYASKIQAIPEEDG